MLVPVGFDSNKSEKHKYVSDEADSRAGRALLAMCDGWHFSLLFNSFE